jgi:hypothetical protein
MAWVAVTITAGGKTYGDRYKLELSDDEYVLHDDKFLALAIRQKESKVSHFVWNPRCQHVSSFRKGFGDKIAQIPVPIRRQVNSIALSTLGRMLGGPMGIVIGIRASRVLSFEGLWETLSVHDDKEVGYYESESGHLSTTFSSLVTISDIQIV